METGSVYEITDYYGNQMFRIDVEVDGRLILSYSGYSIESLKDSVSRDIRPYITGNEWQYERYMK